MKKEPQETRLAWANHRYIFAVYTNKPVLAFLGPQRASSDTPAENRQGSQGNEGPALLNEPCGARVIQSRQGSLETTGRGTLSQGMHPGFCSPFSGRGQRWASRRTNDWWTWRFKNIGGKETSEKTKIPVSRLNRVPTHVNVGVYSHITLFIVLD